MSQIIVEQTFDPPLTPEAHAHLRTRVEPCIEQHGVAWVRSYIAVDGRRLICHLEAPDAETVRAAFRSAGARFDRAWVTEVREPQPSAAV